MSDKVKINDIQVIYDEHGVLRNVNYELKKKKEQYFLPNNLE